jgi:hypothetical protein
MQRTSALAFVLAVLLAVPAAAQDAQPTLAERATAISRRMTEYLELFDSSDPTIRSAAFQMALADENPAIRGLALVQELRRFKQLIPEIVVPAGGRISVADIPSVELREMEWSEDGRAFQGASHQRCGRTLASGVIAGERLALSYDGICIAPALLARPGQAVTPGEPSHLPCQATLIVNKEGNALEGSLRCTGMPITLPMRLPFG